MTHFEKLDIILMGLMTRVKHRILSNSENPKLTFEYLCDILLKDECVEDWEKQFLQNRLMSDGYLSFNVCDGISLPSLTQKGIEFVQKGGYKKLHEKEKLFEEVQISTIKSNNRSKWALIVAILSLTLTMMFNILEFIFDK